LTLADSALTEARSRGSSAPYEGELSRPDGARTAVIFGCTHLRARGADAVFVIDQSARRRTEAVLRESQRQMATLIANLPGLVYRCKPDDGFAPTFVSEGIRALTGHQR
jgi:PAS domain-containing protein